MKKLIFVLALMSAWPVLGAPAQGSDTPHLAFVRLYIEQLGAIEEIRDVAAKELITDPDAQRFGDCVHTMTRYQLEMSAQISAMQGVHLSKPFDSLPVAIADFARQKLALYQQYGAACAAIMEAPKPNTDYGQIAASLPRIGAQLEFIDEGILKATPAVFATLIQLTKTTTHGGPDHLIITKSEKAHLVHRINEFFGDKLKQANQNYIVGAASVLEFYLEKRDYKCSDEP